MEWKALGGEKREEMSKFSVFFPRPRIYSHGKFKQVIYEIVAPRISLKNISFIIFKDLLILCSQSNRESLSIHGKIYEKKRN